MQLFSKVRFFLECSLFVIAHTHGFSNCMKLTRPDFDRSLRNYTVMFVLSKHWLIVFSSNIFKKKRMISFQVNNMDPNMSHRFYQNPENVQLSQEWHSQIWCLLNSLQKKSKQQNLTPDSTKTLKMSNFPKNGTPSKVTTSIFLLVFETSYITLTWASYNISNSS